MVCWFLPCCLVGLLVVLSKQEMLKSSRISTTAISGPPYLLATAMLSAVLRGGLQALVVCTTTGFGVSLGLRVRHRVEILMTWSPILNFTQKVLSDIKKRCKQCIRPLNSRKNVSRYSNLSTGVDQFVLHLKHLSIAERSYRYSVCSGLRPQSTTDKATYLSSAMAEVNGNGNGGQGPGVGKAGILAAVTSTFLLGSMILALALIPIARARGASAICRSGIRLEDSPWWLF